jgi:hypothetical protein
MMPQTTSILLLVFIKYFACEKMNIVRYDEHTALKYSFMQESLLHPGVMAWC